MDALGIWIGTLDEDEPGSCAAQVEERLAEARSVLVDVRDGHGALDLASIALESAEATIAAVRKQIQAHAAEEVRTILSSTTALA